MTSVLNWGLSIGKSLSDQYVPEFVKEHVHKQADKVQDIIHDLVSKQMVLKDQLVTKKTLLEEQVKQRVCAKTEELNSFMFTHVEQLLSHVDQLGDLVLPDIDEEQQQQQQEIEGSDEVQQQQQSKVQSVQATVQKVKALQTKFAPRVQAHLSHKAGHVQSLRASLESQYCHVAAQAHTYTQNTAATVKNTVNAKYTHVAHDLSGLCHSLAHSHVVRTSVHSSVHAVEHVLQMPLVTTAYDSTLNFLNVQVLPRLPVPVAERAVDLTKRVSTNTSQFVKYWLPKLLAAVDEEDRAEVVELQESDEVELEAAATTPLAQATLAAVDSESEDADSAVLDSTSESESDIATSDLQ